MSFATPTALLALALVPVAVAWYVRRERRLRAGAEAFVAAPLAASVAPHRPGWRRHVPVTAFGLALVALVLAAARPQTTVAVPAERATILLVTDVSGSMLATDVAPNRLTAARRAARRFVDRVPRQVNLGVVAFNHQPSVLQAPTRDRAAVRDALRQLRSSGGTATGDAVRSALQLLTGPGRVEGRTAPPAAIVLLSDGASTRGIDPMEAARAAREARIPIYAVALGTPEGTIRVPRPRGQSGTELRRVPPDTATLERMARVSRGQAFSAEAAGRLDAVYERLGSQLGRRDERREITAGFAGGALALLVAGAALSLRWFNRPI